MANILILSPSSATRYGSHWAGRSSGATTHNTRRRGTVRERNTFRTTIRSGRRTTDAVVIRYPIHSTPVAQVASTTRSTMAIDGPPSESVLAVASEAKLTKRAAVGARKPILLATVRPKRIEGSSISSSSCIGVRTPRRHPTSPHRQAVGPGPRTPALQLGRANPSSACRRCLSTSTSARCEPRECATSWPFEGRILPQPHRHILRGCRIHRSRRHPDTWQSASFGRRTAVSLALPRRPPGPLSHPGTRRASCPSWGCARRRRTRGRRGRTR